MENKKSLGVVGLVVLCLAVSALFGIAYAAFSQNLTVSGSATVAGQKWKVAWSAIQADSNNSATGSLPTINSETGVTAVTEWTAAFTNPGQTYKFTITAKNYGDFPAKLTAFTKGTKTCSAAATNGATNYESVCNRITFTVKDSSGNELPAEPDLNTLAATTGTETYTFELSYTQDSTDQTGSSLPDGGVVVTIGTSTFTYTQQ